MFAHFSTKIKKFVSMREAVLYMQSVFSRKSCGVEKRSHTNRRAHFEDPLNPQRIVITLKIFLRWATHAHIYCHWNGDIKNHFARASHASGVGTKGMGKRITKFFSHLHPLLSRGPLENQGYRHKFQRRSILWRCARSGAPVCAKLMLALKAPGKPQHADGPGPPRGRLVSCAATLKGPARSAGHCRDQRFALICYCMCVTRDRMCAQGCESRQRDCSDRSQMKKFDFFALASLFLFFQIIRRLSPCAEKPRNKLLTDGLTTSYLLANMSFFNGVCLWNVIYTLCLW